jgi:fatty-acyl-CoA synthase
MKAPYSRTLFDLLCEQADRSAAGPAVISAAATVTYPELVVRSRRVAGALRDAGIRRGDRIGLLSGNRPEWLEIFFGCAALGATVVPFSTWSTAAELDFLLNDAKVRWLFTVDSYSGRPFAEDIARLRADARLSTLEQVISIDGPLRADCNSYATLQESAALLDNLAPAAGASAGDTLVILYTSGSSNRPKVVPLQHYATIENAFNIGERQGLTPADRVLIAIPLFWSYGAVNALPAVVSHGATLVLQSHFEAGGALTLIERHACTALYTLPAMTNALIAHPQFHPQRTRTLRTGVTIGTPQDIRNAAEQLGVTQICNIYGGTENYGNCCVTPHDWPLQQRAVCQGPPLPGVQIRIHNSDTGQEAATGEIGQIEVKGYLTPGYTGSSAGFNSTTFSADGYFKTGDLGSLNEPGWLTFTGRSSELIKRSGINVSPAEVEEILQQHPAVALAGVTGVADAQRGEIIVAYVILKADAVSASEQLIAHCRDHLSRYKIPERIFITDALPVSATGKL